MLDGIDDRARTESAMDLGNGSFTVSLRVRLSSGQCGRNMAAISQAGTRTSGFVIRCSERNRWELALADRDADDANVTTLYDDVRLPNADAQGQHLTVVYNSFTNEVRLYVNGQLDTAVGIGRYSSMWQGAGGLQVGRSLLAGVFGEYFTGDVDEVRIYRGVADDQLIQQLSVAGANANI